MVIELFCKKCGWEWVAATIESYGYTYLVNDDDWVCPNCGGEGEEK